MRNRNSQYSKTYCQTHSCDKSTTESTLNTTRKNQTNRNNIEEKYTSPSVSTEELPDYKSIKSTDRVLHFNDCIDISAEKESALKSIALLRESLSNIKSSLSPEYKSSISMQLLLDNVKIIEIEVKKIRQSDCNKLESISMAELQKINIDFAKSSGNPLNISSFCKDVNEFNMNLVGSPHNLISAFNSTLSDIICYMNKDNSVKPLTNISWVDISLDRYITQIIDYIEAQKQGSDYSMLEKCYKEKENRYKDTIKHLTNELVYINELFNRELCSKSNAGRQINTHIEDSTLKDTLDATVKNLKEIFRDDGKANQSHDCCSKQIRVLTEQIRYLKAEMNAIKVKIK